MRPSAKKTPVAVLRTFLDENLKQAGRGKEILGQVGFGTLIGKSLSTVQGLETGRLPLSEETAKIISDRTGVSVAWLLRGLAAAPMIEASWLCTKADRDQQFVDYWSANETPAEFPSTERPYTLQSYDRARANNVREAPSGVMALSLAISGDFLMLEMKKIVDRFSAHPDGEFRMWRLEQTLQRIGEEFPEDS